MFAAVTLGVAAIILHGSLYPYDFHVAPGDSGPLSTLLSTWAQPPTSLGDLLANIFLYIPLGLFMSLALGGNARIWTMTLAGFFLCTSVELLQFYDAGRVTNASDIYLNTFGTWIGAIIAGKLGSALIGPLARLNPIPCMLIAALAGYKLFPYVPTIDLHKYWQSLKPVIDHPAINPFALFRYFALWLTADYLVANAARWSRPAWMPVAFFACFILGAKVLIVNQSLSPSEIIGAGCAFGLWLVVRKQSGVAAFVGCALCAAIVAQRLEPFDFQTSHVDFGWLPFRSFLHGSTATNIQSMFEKVFLYGSLIWIAGLAGLRLLAATTATTLILLLTSFAETYLPGRSGEITDALIALGMGICISAIHRARAGAGDSTAKRSA